jgi:hypothetical protein
LGSKVCPITKVEQHAFNKKAITGTSLPRPVKEEVDVKKKAKMLIKESEVYFSFNTSQPKPIYLFFYGIIGAYLEMLFTGALLVKTPCKK